MAAKGYKLSTFEQSAGSLNVKNKSGRVKMPDVAKHFDVEVHTLFPRATSQVSMQAWIFGDCREGQIPRCSAALQV
ncbi:hypothetical protein [Eisenbergiella sp.]